MPIFNYNDFDHYHLFPILQNNLTIIPEQPYLMLSSLNHQYEEEPCGAIENLYICSDKLIQNDENCIISLIQNIKKRRRTMTPIHTPNTITKKLSHNYVLVIPGTRPSKFEKTCKSNGYFIVNKPSVIKIPHHCKIENDKSTYINEENLIIGEPFVLPPIEREETEEHLPIEQLNLSHIDLDDIAQLKRKASTIHATTVIQYHPAHSVYINIVVILTLALCAVSIWKMKKFWQKKTQPTIPEDRTPAENFEKTTSVFDPSILEYTN
jgi:hypothetical protein